MSTSAPSFIEPFARSAHWYDTIYGKRDYALAAKTIAKLTGDPSPYAPTLIEYGCGTGKYLEEFKKLGYEVTGVDPTPSMRAISDAKGFDVFPGSLTDSHGGEYWLAVSLFSVFSYAALTAEAMDQALNTLDDSGRYMAFDFLNYAAAATSLRPVEYHIFENALDERLERITKKSFDPQTGLVTYDFEFIESYEQRITKRWRERHVQRAFTPAEIAYAMDRLDRRYVMFNPEKPYTEDGSLSQVGLSWYGMVVTC